MQKLCLYFLFYAPYILKTLKPEFADNLKYKELLKKEFIILNSLDHPNIVRAYSFENVEHIGWCIVMEFVDGITLTEFLKTEHCNYFVCKKIIEELLSALQYIHNKQIVHRDLKPDNILITYNGNNVKLIDFGLSDQDDFAILKQPAGTRKYAAPEQLNAEQTIDNRADIYAFGLILIQIFAGEPLPELIHDVPFPFDRVAKKCVEKDRTLRYASVGEILPDINKTTRRNTIIRIIIIVAALLALGFVSFLFKQQQTFSPSNKTIQKIASDSSLTQNDSTSFPSIATPLNIVDIDTIEPQRNTRSYQHQKKNQKRGK